MHRVGLFHKRVFLGETTAHVVVAGFTLRTKRILRAECHLFLVDLLVELADELLAFDGQAQFSLLGDALTSCSLKLFHRTINAFNSLVSKITSTGTEQYFLAVQILILQQADLHLLLL